MKIHNQVDSERSCSEINDVYDKICKALNQLDIEAALNYFADRDDMLKISNGQVLRGKKHLADYWHQRIGNLTELQISISNVEIHRIDDQHVWAVADELITMGGHQQKAVVTNIFVKTATGWKILLDHTTYIPST